jgi:Zn-dependent protease with chaperone function
MKQKLVFGSVVSLGVLFVFAFVVLGIADQATLQLGTAGVVGITLLFSFVMWLISPFLMDLTLRFFYKSEKLTFQDFAAKHPESARFLQEACARFKVPLPAMRIIHDQNPTAYCFGSYPGNSRMVLTDGIFHYLNEQEVNAVIGHELGHIVHWDFVVMTIASTILTVLYEISQMGMRKRGGNDKNPLAAAALLAYVFYIIGSYVILYLSRTREYLADRFSAEATGHPEWLSTALVKVAYGITDAAMKGAQPKLLVATRAMGFFDHKSAKSTGSAYAYLAQTRTEKRMELLFGFDLLSPWAEISEFFSTHPLTGKRVQQMQECCRELGVHHPWDVSTSNIKNLAGPDVKGWGGFFFDVLVYLSPVIGFLGGGIVAAIVHAPWAYSLPFLITGAGTILMGIYKFPKIREVHDTTVFDLMCDVNASPLHGRPMTLNGQFNGMVNAGTRWGGNLMMNDATGMLPTSYSSRFPIIGDLIFSVSRSKKLVGQTARVSGWFFRSTGGQVAIHQIESPLGKLMGAPRLQYFLYGAFWLGIGAIVWLVNA